MTRYVTITELALKQKTIWKTKGKSSVHRILNLLDPAVSKHRRLKAVEYFKEGLSHTLIASMLYVSRTAVSKWHTTWKRYGKEGLMGNKRGPRFRLSPEQEQAITKGILKGASSCGYSDNKWTLKKIADYIEKSTGIHYNTNAISPMLDRLGITFNKHSTTRYCKIKRGYRKKTNTFK